MQSDLEALAVPAEGSRWAYQSRDKNNGQIWIFQGPFAAGEDGGGVLKGTIVFVLQNERAGNYRCWTPDQFRDGRFVRVP
jgi:hypothetical protein